PPAAAAQLVVDATRLVPLGAEDVEAAGSDHQPPLLGADLPVLLEDVLVARLVLLRHLLELLTDLLDGGDVLGAVRLGAPLRSARAGPRAPSARWQPRRRPRRRAGSPRAPPSRGGSAPGSGPDRARRGSARPSSPPRSARGWRDRGRARGSSGAHRSGAG